MDGAAADTTSRVGQGPNGGANGAARHELTDRCRAELRMASAPPAWYPAGAR